MSRPEAEPAEAAPTLPAAHELIPHAPPMALVSSFLRVDEQGACLCVDVGSLSMFAGVDGCVEPVVLLECMAQACAAFGGWRARRNSSPPQRVFLVGTRCFEIFDKAQANLPMEVELCLDREFGGFHLFRATLSQQGAKLARADLKAYHPPASAQQD